MVYIMVRRVRQFIDTSYPAPFPRPRHKLVYRSALLCVHIVNLRNASDILRGLTIAQKAKRAYEYPRKRKLSYNRMRFHRNSVRRSVEHSSPAALKEAVVILDQPNPNTPMFMPSLSFDFDAALMQRPRCVLGFASRFPTP